MDLIDKNKKRWLASDKVSQKDKNLILKMNKEEADEAFFKDIEFGTAGMRGILGPGTNKMNEFTVRKATIGFAMYILEQFHECPSKSIVISHDNRFMSREFTLQSAEIMNEMGIKAYIFDSLRPTPELSYAVRELHACGGIMITASHNPKEYNGYKVYDETGCQLVPNKISRLVDIINNLPNELTVEPLLSNIKETTVVLDNKIDDSYVSHVESIQLNKDLDKSNFKIVFTPQHGTSYLNAMRIFRELSYNVIPVSKQCEPDPNFSGTLSPNPEDSRSFIEPIKLAKEVNANLILMTDPDGDRVGVGYLSSKGTYETFTGNQGAALLIDYIFSQRKEKGLLAKNGVMYDTIVSSSLGRDIADSYGIKCESFLTGFKFIGNRIDYYEHHNGPTFEFGYEESYGCLISPFARDKDGLQAILMYAEMALYHYLRNEPLDVVYEQLEEKYGYHNDVCYSIAFKGSEGLSEMKSIMEELHKNAPKEILDKKVVKVCDYKKQESIDNSGKIEKIDLPISDVVILHLSDKSQIAIRPSGTEPKCKFYMGVVGKSSAAVKDTPLNLYHALLDYLGIKY
jgi:phosphoglucomutase